MAVSTTLRPLRLFSTSCTLSPLGCCLDGFFQRGLEVAGSYRPEGNEYYQKVIQGWQGQSSLQGLNLSPAVLQYFFVSRQIKIVIGSMDELVVDRRAYLRLLLRRDISLRAANDRLDSLYDDSRHLCEFFV